MDPQNRGLGNRSCRERDPRRLLRKLGDAVATHFILRPSAGVTLTCILCLFLPFSSCMQYGDAEHITAILGEAVVLNCPVSQPETPYIIQWKRQHHKIPIYIWYDGYDPHVEDNYKGRASRVNPTANYGLASLNLTSVKENDQGWYECNVFYLDRTGATDNGTWIHLDVHAPPRFVTTPDDVTYVNIGDSIILNCEAEGTPTPEIMWFRDDKPVTPSDTVGIFNDGTELRINKIRDGDIGDYLCVARNAEGRVVHDAKVVIAGGAVILNGPHNITRLEGEKAEFPCEAKALPGNVTVTWKRENVPIDQLSWLDTRSIVKRDGTLVINPTSADDGGFFTCEVSNGIGSPQRATAYLNVEYPARVSYTPTVQYLPFRQQGIIKCHIKSNPPNRFVTWIKDKRLFDPDNEEGVVRLKNGSLLITKVNQSHQGRYSCTPYNKHTTAGSSGDMEVLVREPPVFNPKPQPEYYAEVGEEVTLVCGGQGSPTPTIGWKRRDGQNLPRDRAQINGGNLTMKALRKGDHGYYECEVKNDIMSIVASTLLMVEGTTPHPPYNISTDTTPFSVSLSWLPGYAGGRDFEQKYTIWYRTLGSNTWSQVDVKPAGSTNVAIHNLSPDSTYEFQVQGKNKLGDGMFSDIVTATTKEAGGGQPKPKIQEKEKEKDKENVTEPPYPDDEEATPEPPSATKPEYDYWLNVLPTDSSGLPYFPIIINPKDSLPLGPRPGAPYNLNVKRVKDGFLMSWEAPQESPVPVQYYDIEYEVDPGGWKKFNKEQIVGETSYKVKRLTSEKKYVFRVLAKTVTSFEASDTLIYHAPEITKEKEVIAALVGGFLFFIVAIILSVCTVKICNDRKQKKQENAYNMVACRVSDARNGGQPSSPVPLKKLIRSGISSVRSVWRWLLTSFLGLEALDVTDSYPLRPSQDYERYPRPDDSKEMSAEDFLLPGSQYDMVFEPHRRIPLASISRTMEGKFVLDKDSEEGGFTSPRRPVRGIGRIRPRPPLYHYYRRPLPFSGFRRFGLDRESYLDQWRTLPPGIEGGVYHVRAGTTQPLIRHTPQGPEMPEEGRLAFYPVYSTVSPEFGRHTISDTEETGPIMVDGRRVLSSSPTPYSDEWNQLAQLVAFEEVSSVRQPSSVERSFPSTVLSSLQASSQKTPPLHGTPMHPESLLRERGQTDYERIIEQQELMLQQHRLLMRQQREQDLRRELPVVSPLRRHVVSAQVHSPEFMPPPAVGGAYYSRQPLRYSWMMAPSRPLFGLHRHIPYATAATARYRSPYSHLFAPPYRETVSYVPPADAPRHYVNLPQRPVRYEQPYYLLKRASPEIQKPLATSSPPRPRSHPRFKKPSKAKLSTKTDVPEIKPKSKDNEALGISLQGFVDSDSSSDRPAAYTRDHLQQAIGRVRSGIRRIRRPHSAPILSSTGRTDSSFVDTSQESDKKVEDKSQEISEEQSPDSSSGFGSKNTSHQQSSSQSGQSTSALGLDSSRLESSEAAEPVLQWPTRERRRVPMHPSLWARPLIRPRSIQHQHPPPYDRWLTRQILPQFRLPGHVHRFASRTQPTLLMGVPRAPPMTPVQLPLPQDLSVDSTGTSAVAEPIYEYSEDPRIYSPIQPSYARRMKPTRDVTQPLTITTSRSALDVSVDDHYEFDTVLSPTPGGEESDAFWSRSRLYSGDRGLSDSEIYGTGSRRKESQESMEARVAAMKQEFHEYRQKQAKKRSSKELESVC